MDDWANMRYYGVPRPSWTQQDLDDAIARMWDEQDPAEKEQYGAEINQISEKAKRVAEGGVEPVVEPQESPSEAMKEVGGELHEEEES